MKPLLNEALQALNAQRPRPGAFMIHGDALRVLAALPTASIDLMVCDPPYRLSNNGTTNSGGKRVSVNKGAWDAAGDVEDDHNFDRTWLRSAQRVLKPEGTLWTFGTHHNLFSTGFAMQRGGWRIINHVAWTKPNPPPTQHQRSLTHSHESILWASPNHDEPQRHAFHYDLAKTVNDGKQLRDTWEFSAPTLLEKEDGRHAAQKPLRLLERIISLTSNPGDVVMDFFAGSSTTGLAALALGRQYIGVELDKEHFALSMRRLSR